MKKKINDRCRLQAECERTCKYVKNEIECDYYAANVRPGYEIVDQEMRRPAATQDAIPVDLVEVDNGPRLVNIPIDHLHPHHRNPRKNLGDLSELADSIKAKGVLQNLTVVPMVLVDPDATITMGDDHYVVLIGHRRMAAAKLAGLTELPCAIVDMDEREQVQTMLVENMQRSDLTVYEEAKGFQMMLDLGDTIETVAEKTGFSQSTVRSRVKLADLDEAKFKKACELPDGSVTAKLAVRIGPARGTYKKKSHWTKRKSGGERKLKMPRELDLTEFNKLEQLLKDAGIPYEREDREDVPRKEVEAMGFRHYFDHHEIYYPSKAEHLSDAVISYGSYGSASGLLEQMGLIPPVTQDSVQGELFAEEVFERWKEHWERTLEEANSVDEKSAAPPIGVRCYDDCYWVRDDYGDEYTPPTSECGKDDGSFERLNLDPCYSERDVEDCPDCPFYLNRDAIEQMAADYHRGEPLEEEWI